MSRLSYDILGTVPIAEVDVGVRVVRAGRTIELVEAELGHDGRVGVRLRGWLQEARDTAALAGTTHEVLPGPGDIPSWDATSVWPGGFIGSVEVRRHQQEAGRGTFWVRTGVPLVADEDVSALSRTAGLLDIANGMTVRAEPGEVLFPNIDLTAHFFQQPQGEWVGFDTRVSFGTGGLGLTASVVHDVRGPVGTSAQSLTVRPR